VVVEGMALSAASLIAMSGDTIQMAAGSQMMVHEARGMTHGTSDDIRKFADIVESTTEQMVAIYAARSGRDKTKVAKDLKDETFMSAEEAVELGYATEVLEAKALAAHFDLSEIVADVDKIPAGLRELAAGSVLQLEDVVLNGPKDSPSDEDGLGDNPSPSPIAVMSGLAASSPITNMTRKNP
jgi:ATP-dependent Clp protease protease subunit